MLADRSRGTGCRTAAQPRMPRQFDKLTYAKAGQMSMQRQIQEFAEVNYRSVIKFFDVRRACSTLFIYYLGKITKERDFSLSRRRFWAVFLHQNGHQVPHIPASFRQRPVPVNRARPARTRCRRTRASAAIRLNARRRDRLIRSSCSRAADSDSHSPANDHRA